MTGFAKYDYRNQGLPGIEKAAYVIPTAKEDKHKKVLEQLASGAMSFIDRSVRGHVVKVGANQVSGFFHSQKAAQDYLDILKTEARKLQK